MVDTRRLWDQRQSLIEDIRALADEVLGLSDDAIERVKMPEPLAREDLEPGPATSEDQFAGPIALSGEANGPQPVDFDPVEDAEPYRVDSGEDETAGDEADAYWLEPVAEGSSAADEPGHTVELEALPGGAEEALPEAADDEGSESEPRGSGPRAPRLTYEGQLAAAAATRLSALVRRLARRAERLGEQPSDDAGGLAARLLADAQRAVDALLGAAREPWQQESQHQQHNAHGNDDSDSHGALLPMFPSSRNRLLTPQ